MNCVVYYQTHKNITCSHVLPNDGNFEYRISYQDYNTTEYAIYSPPSQLQIHEQQWFHGTNLLREIHTRTDNTFGINVDNYCLYYSPGIKTVRQQKRFYWFDCTYTYNPSQTLEKRIATNDYRRQPHVEFRVFFSFENIYILIHNLVIIFLFTISIKTIVTNNQQSVNQIPIYFVLKKTDIKIDDATSPLDMFHGNLTNENIFGNIK